MLHVTNLGCARGGAAVLSDVSFQLGAGQALILRGPNGIGKTTLLRTLAGLQPALSGEVTMPEDSAAYASHADGVKTALTVTENLRFWAAIYGLKFDPAILTRFDLADLRDRQGGTLSAGQKRRLGLARLAVIGRKILFLDEPTVSLDTGSVAMFARWLQDDHLAQGGIAIIATHIDLGIDAPALDLTPFKSAPGTGGGTDEAFL
ncbi:MULTISPECIES: heme ABC exporter ATP-binding protein CcmA [unclassified Yoonia]|uniref:heme ABC exporter ATP-binding protein CcmA n=1 Tax=unclassified Yoonia TaxID=2629118 RepID=UPI002AFF636B|nr:MULTISPECIES: heme ABC exporter ATP-binding protein CcmA [unclassified Yoonia]